MLVELGRLPDALVAYRKGFDIAKRLAKSNADNPMWQRLLSNAYGKLANYHRETHDPAKAHEALVAGRDVVARLIDRYPT